MEFYDKYFNNYYCRDIRLLNRPNGKSNLTAQSSIADIPIESVDLDQIQQHRLKRYLGEQGNIYAELSFFKDKQSFKNNNTLDRYVNHIIFDFDQNDPRLQPYKDGFKDNPYDLENQQGFRDTILNTDVLHKPFEEAKLVCDLFDKEPFMVFSGSGGCHAHLWFEECSVKEFDNFNNAVEQWATYLVKDLDLTTFDYAVVKDPIARVIRIPGSINLKTGLYTIPFTWNEPISSILNRSRTQPQLGDFNVEDYTYDNLLPQLKKFDKVVVEKPKTYTSNVVRSTTSNYTESNVDKPFSDMRDLMYLLFPNNFAKHYNGYDMYRCPLHQDKEASAWVNKKGFGCYGCGIHNINYFDFIRVVFDLRTNDQVKKYMKNIREVYINESRK